MDKKDFHPDISMWKLTADDAVALSAIAINAYCDHYRHSWYEGVEWYIEKSFSVSNLEKELADTNAVFYMVFSEDRAVGFIKINIDAAFEDFSEKDAMDLEWMFLTSEASGKGIGSYLLQRILGFAKQRNKKLVWLKMMDSSSSAINFYKRNGFEICGTTRPNFVQMKEEVRDQMKQEVREMIIMKKALLYGQISQVRQILRASS